MTHAWIRVDAGRLCCRRIIATAASKPPRAHHEGCVAQPVPQSLGSSRVGGGACGAVAPWLPTPAAAARPALRAACACPALHLHLHWWAPCRCQGRPARGKVGDQLALHCTPLHCSPAASMAHARQPAALPGAAHRLTTAPPPLWCVRRRLCVTTSPSCPGPGPGPVGGAPRSPEAPTMTSHAPPHTRVPPPPPGLPTASSCAAPAPAVVAQPRASVAAAAPLRPRPAWGRTWRV